MSREGGAMSDAVWKPCSLAKLRVRVIQASGYSVLLVCSLLDGNLLSAVVNTELNKYLSANISIFLNNVV